MVRFHVSYSDFLGVFGWTHSSHNLKVWPSQLDPREVDEIAFLKVSPRAVYP